MIVIPDYDIYASIYENDRVAIYRGKHSKTGQPVIIKMLRSEYPTMKQIASLRHEYELSRQLQIDGVVQVVQLATVRHLPVLILEDVGGISLKQYLSSHQLNLSEFLHIAVQLTNTLEEIQLHHIIHKDIKPDNIIIHPETLKVKITDFSNSSVLASEQLGPFHTAHLEGTLAYMSPEQTGRMNRSIDHRTDYYSLGITFYEMLSGQLPFQAADPLEMIYSHLAKRPVPLSQLRISIPESVSEIIMKCIAKNAEDRYQSAHGLKEDLKTCLREWEEHATISNFPVGRFDRSERLQIPQTLYGREREIEELLRVFTRAEVGQAELLFISGYSGSGKTSLVYELHQSVVRTDGFFTSGKFDPFKRDIPYYGWIEAFRDITRQLLTKDEGQILIWKQQILEAVGNNGQLLIDIIPELLVLIGPQPSAPELPTTDSQRRFHHILQSFISVFMNRQKPLCIFLDDLQWMDSASLSFMQEVLTSPASEYICIIGAYRDQEVTPSHPLMLAIAQLQSTVSIGTIALSSLQPEQVHRLVADALGQLDDAVLPLSELIYHKTEGNPFFVNQFLISLYEEGVLAFDHHSGAWTWDMDLIERKGSTDNVVDLMVHRLKKLSEQSRHVLTLASCIGNRFDLHTIALIAQMTLSDTAAVLLEAIEEKLLIPLDGNYKFIHYMQDIEIQEMNWKITYRFLHDRIQQAAYLSIPELTMRETHLQIGRSLLEHCSEEQLEEQIYTIVHQLNASASLMNSTERNRLCELNIIAGKRAKASGAYDSAAEYLRTANKLLEENCWHSKYDTTYTLYTELSEAEFLNGNFEKAEQSLSTALSHARSKLDQAKIYGLKAVLFTSMNKYEAALEAGIKALHLFKIRIPRNPSKIAIIREYMKIKWRMRNKTADDLLSLPVMQDAEIKAIMQFMFDITSPAYFTNSNLFIYLIMRMTDLSLKYGNTEISVVGYGAYGCALSVALGDTKLGYDMGMMSMQLNEQLPHAGYRCTSYYAYGNTIHHWTQPIKTAIPYLKTSYQAGIDSGNFLYAGFSVTYIILMMEYMGDSLSMIEQETDNWLPFIERTKNEDMLMVISLIKAMIHNLQGNTFDVLTFDSEEFQESHFIQHAKSSINKVLLQGFYMYKAQALYMFEAYDYALAMSSKSHTLLDAVIGLINVPKHYFYHYLIMAAVYPQADPRKQRQYKRSMKQISGKMQTWSENSPHNFKHQALLMKAEQARLFGQDALAETYYNQSIQLAEEEGFRQHAALGSELAAKFFASRGIKRIAQAYMTDAYYLYIQWGATAKAEQLLQQHPELISSSMIQTDANISMTDTKSTIGTTRTSKETSSDELDLLTILKASHAMSGQIIQEQLVKKLMELVMENAGAEKAVLLFEKQGELFIEAEFDARKQRSTVLNSEPLQHANYMSQSIALYVARTLEVVVLDDATSLNPFSHDKYVHTKRPKSLLCIPILHHGKLFSILYLENNLTTGVFTLNRLQVLQMLASQFAISMENSRLYTSLEHSRDEISKWNLELEQKVKDRTFELEQALGTVQRTQNRLIQSEKMVALGNLVAGVAHEINTPIGIGVTVASHLDQKTKTIVELANSNQMKRSDLNDYFQTMMESTDIVLLNLKRASDLIRSFKKVAVDQSSGEKRRFHVKPYMDEVLLSLGMKLKKTKHQVIVECDEQLSIYSDPGALSQIATNLLMNSLTHAFDPADEGQLHFVIRVQANELIIQYSDNGKGMAAEAVRMIFDPFYTTKRGSGGTGLGMHIVYNIVTQSLNGTIECASEIGSGTEFMIRLPLELKESEHDGT